MSGCCGKIIRGAIGLTKVALGVDRADEWLIVSRRDICRLCELASKSSNPRFAANQGLTNWSVCRGCSCLIVAKTTLISEKCPEGKW